MCIHLECVGDCIDMQENIHACTHSWQVQRSMSNVFLNHSPPYFFFFWGGALSRSGIHWFDWSGYLANFSCPSFFLPQQWHYRNAPVFLYMGFRRIRVRSLCLYGQHSTDWAFSPAPLLTFIDSNSLNRTGRIFL